MAIHSRKFAFTIFTLNLVVTMGAPRGPRQLVMNIPVRPGSSKAQHTLEGDIVGVSLDALLASSDLRAGRDEERLRWPNAIIPYVIGEEYDDTQTQLILGAMKGFDETCVRFINRTEETDHILIAPGFGCTSFIGRIGGRQIVSLAPACLQEAGAIQHELMHTVGFYHEQARMDRDDYVQINWNNIIPGERRQFSHYTASLDQAYDFGSIMHYGEYSFSRDTDKGLWTIRPLDKFKERVAQDSRSGTIGQRVWLSMNDIDKINKRYKCSPSTPTTTPSVPPSTSHEPDSTEGASFADAAVQTTSPTSTTEVPNVVTPDVAFFEPLSSTSEPDITYNYELKSGESLDGDQTIWNMNKNVKFSIQPEGNAVLVRSCDGAVIWQSSTTGHHRNPPHSLTMQEDGNLAIYDAAEILVWSTGTAETRFANATLRVTNSGFLCIYKDSVCLWESGGLSLCRPSPSPMFKAATVLLKPGGTLTSGHSLSSSNKNCQLTLQPDGDLVLRHRCRDAEIWSVRNDIGQGPDQDDNAADQDFTLTLDGNLMVQRSDGSVSFQISVPNASGADLRILRNCRMCIFKNGACLWTAPAKEYYCPSDS